MLLQSPRIKLRALEAEDLDVLYKWENDTSAWDSSSIMAPFSRKQLWDYIETYDGDIYRSGQLRLMIAEPGTDNRVGMVDLTDFDAVNRRASVGIFIAGEFRGRGLAAEAINLLERYSFDRLGLHQLVATVAVDNQSSVSMFTGAGFRICGRPRSWIRCGESYKDVFIFQKILSPSRFCNE